MPEMKLSYHTTYKGRNGHGTCVGFEVQDGLRPSNHPAGTIRIYPVNSRNTIGSCWIEIPFNDVPAFTAVISGGMHELILNKLPRESLLLLMGVHPALDAEIEKRLKQKG